MIAEYWSAVPRATVGHWMRLTQWVSARDDHGLDDDVKMFREEVIKGMREKGEQEMYPGCAPYDDSIIADPREFI
jgi:hypothetical protein